MVDLIFILIILGLFIWIWILQRKVKELKKEVGRVEHEKQEEENIASGLEEFNQKIQAIKQQRKQKIVKELKEKKKIQADHVADLFKVSRTTAFRYLEELEQEGKIEQVGAFGPNVHYQIKQ